MASPSSLLKVPSINERVQNLGLPGKFKPLLQNDSDTGRIFSQPPLTSFKRDKIIGNFLIRSVFQTSDQPETLRWLETVSSTFQDLEFEGSLLPLFIGCSHNHGIKKLPNHW